MADQPFAHLISAAAVVSAAFGACPTPFTTKLAPGKTWKDASVFWLDEMQTKKGTETRYFIKDNGIDIEAEFHEEIFHIFKRLNEEDDDKKGTGAGLTFVRKIVDRHGGRIWLESELGKGTTFYFTLTAGVACAAAA